MAKGVIIAFGLLAAAGLSAGAASAEVDVRTPWADVYVGPGGVFVQGPWGRVDVPEEDRDRVCREWRRNVLTHYGDRDCEVEFDAEGCMITRVECPD